jgi:hypothetical protein
VLVHDRHAALEYAQRLAGIAGATDRRPALVMRVYFEKLAGFYGTFAYNWAVVLPLLAGLGLGSAMVVLAHASWMPPEFRQRSRSMGACACLVWCWQCCSSGVCRALD